ncbi:MAG: quercetin 2,3-dioxygenase [Propionibacteriaceae bacterium]|nr:quercetin 2,3-dioxygenase [Propionibacteriaceae bacterium]
MSVDIEANHGRAPLLNRLPGEPVPYYLASGEGHRVERDGQLWTIIARAGDAGGLFDAAYVLGPRGAGAEAHSVPYQRTYVVFDGRVLVQLPGESRVLAPGDSVTVPAGVPVAYRLLGHLTRLLFWSAPGGALDALAASGPIRSHLYGADAAASLGVPLLTGVEAAASDWTDPRDPDDDTLPAGVEPFFLRRHGGDRIEWPDAVNAFAARGRNTGGRYIMVNTLAAPQPYIIRHFHSLHTENFFCLSGRVWLWVNGQEVLLTPGDFVHAPAGTIHSFAIAAHNTTMLGLLANDVFEPFFDVTGIATEAFVHTEGKLDAGVVMSGMRANPDLDVTVVGPPPKTDRF